MKQTVAVYSQAEHVFNSAGFVFSYMIWCHLLSLNNHRDSINNYNISNSNSNFDMIFVVS